MKEFVHIPYVEFLILPYPLWFLTLFDMVIKAVQRTDHNHSSVLFYSSIRTLSTNISSFCYGQSFVASLLLAGNGGVRV